MNAVGRIVGRAMPLDRENVDTDQIIPAHWLKRIERTGYGDGLFEAWRRDPAFVLNDPRYRGAQILIAGANFGSGSSREHAAWALLEAGFRAVIAPKLADIFRANATKNGLVPVTLAVPAVAALLEAATRDPTLEIRIDVEAGTVAADAIALHEHYLLDERSREALLSGRDEIAMTERFANEITAYENARPAWMPAVMRRTS